MEEGSSQNPTVSQSPSNEGSSAIKVILVIVLVLGVLVGIFFGVRSIVKGVNNLQPSSEDSISSYTKGTVSCESTGIGFNLISCGYTKSSFYDAEVAFKRTDSNENSIQSVKVFLISEDNQINQKEINSNNWAQIQKVNFSKVYNEPTAFFILVKLNESVSCSIQQVSCIGSNIAPQDIVETPEDNLEDSDTPDGGTIPPPPPLPS